MADLDSLLQGIASTDGVRAVVVASRDGLLIHGAQQGSQEDLDALAAIAASVVSNLQTLGGEMGRKSLDQVIAEFGDATFLLQPVGSDASLVVMADGAGNLGRIRFLVRRHAAEVGQAIDQM
jgi:predicted regulator of Ras-like GTPase activity (Roadblock/LC7/MglB family)